MIWVKFEELVDPALLESIPFEHKLNLNMLWYKISLLRASCKIPFTIRNPRRPRAGYRTIQMHEEIYGEINKKRLEDGEDMVVPPMGSQHLIGAACDIFDPDKKIQKWLLGNAVTAEKIGLWFEHFKYTPNWVHAQIYPPSSGSLFFIP